MRILANQTGVQAPDADYPKGRIVNNQTIINEEINGDIINLFQKLVSLASISENGNPDNETNGYQLLQAFAAYVRSLAATESASGVVERATQSEVNGGSDDARYVTPLKLRSTTFITAQIPNLAASKITSGTFAAARLPQATEGAIGAAEIATGTETITGTNDTKIITPLKLASLTANTTRRGLIEIATEAETIAGSDTQRAVMPKGFKDALDDRFDSLKAVRVSMGTSKDFTTTTVYTVSLPGGISANQVYSISGVVYNDSGDRVYPLDKINTVSLNPGLSYFLNDTTDEINFSSPTGGYFDNAEFNGSGTRGYFVIWYV